MKITEFEATTQIWLKVEAEINERLTIFREKNDGSLDAVETARVRGMIAMCKEILAWRQSGPENIIS